LYKVTYRHCATKTNLCGIYSGTGYIENSVYEEAPQLHFVVVVEILRFEKVRFEKNAMFEKIVFTCSSVGGLFPISP